MEGNLCPNEGSLNKNNKKFDKKFPQGTSYEKELMINFKYFNVFWYDPNNTNDYDNFKICFKNVRSIKGNNLNSMLSFFTDETPPNEWIIITPGSKGEEMVLNLEKNKFVHAFFVYCKNTKLHEKWAKSIKKVKCITSNPETLCKELIEINKEFLFPNFKYNDDDIDNNQNDFDLLINLNKIETKNIYALNAINAATKKSIKSFSKIKNLYTKFCMKSFQYLNNEKCYLDFAEPIPDENSPFYYFAILYQTSKEGELTVKKLIQFFKNTVFLSLYFSQYKYLFNLLTFEEVKDIYKEGINQEKINDMSKPLLYSEELNEKIRKNNSILDEKIKLKELQKFYIMHIFYKYISLNINFYQVVNYLRDFDFCLRMYIYSNFNFLNNKNHSFYEDLFQSMSNSFRHYCFTRYLEDEEYSKELNEESKRIINDTLKVKDFLVIGNKSFQEKIEAIEKNLEKDSFKYLQINEISDYIIKKNADDKKKKKIRAYFYYIIITFEEFQNNLEQLILLSAELGITFINLVYIEKDNSSIQKNYIDNMFNLVSIILVYSIEEIIKYFSHIIKFNYPMESGGIFKTIELYEEPNDLDEIEEKDYQDGCFELAETFDKSIIKNKIALKFGEDIETSEISRDLYNVYKEHKALDLFFKQNIKFTNFHLQPEMQTLDICFIKRILYLYCREEKEHQKSFYRMINGDLISKDPKKIDRFIILLGFIYRAIENKELASYNGKVYRATKLDENFILKLKSGTTMINTTFWSTTKDFKVAKRFMEKNAWRNAYIICKNSATNIDIDCEKINPFNEKEVLILPFTEFKVEKIFSEFNYGKKIYIIEVIELGNKSLIKYDDMNIKNFNDLDVTKAVEKYVVEKIKSK